MDSVRRDHHRDRRRRRHARPPPRPLGEAHPAARARRLAAARAAELVGPGRVRGQPLRLAGHVVRRERQALPARCPLRRRWSDEDVRRCAVPASQGGLRRAAASRRHLAGLADRLRRAGAVLHARGAALPRPRRAGRGPDRASFERAVPASRRVARAADPAARRRPRGSRLPAVPRAVRGHARRVEPAVLDLHPLRDLRRLPVPRPCEVGRRGARRSAGARAPERDAPDEREGHEARHERAGHRGHRGGRRAGRGRGAVRGRHRRRRMRRRQHGQAAVAVGERQAPERPRQRLGSGRPQLHVPRLDGRPCSLARGEHDRVPEDAGAQRLLLRRRRLRVPDGQRADGRQVDGSDVPRRATARHEAGPGLDAGADGARMRSTSGSRPRICHRPTTGSPSSRTATSS